MFYSLTKLCLWSSYSMYKGGAMDPHPQVIPPGPLSKEPHREPHEHLIPPANLPMEMAFQICI